MARVRTHGTSAAVLALLLAAPIAAQDAAESPPLELGVTAPDFELPGATRYGVLSQPVRLSDFAGKVVVLAFFPRARTRGCTIQMHSYRDQYAELANSGQDVVLIAISSDPVEELYSWARDDQFQFLMASDEDMAVARQFGAAREGRNAALRNLFVVGKDGKIAHRMIPFLEVDPTSYVELSEVIDRLAPPPAPESPGG